MTETNADIMVDLETMDTRASASILSIGACLVNWEENKPTDPFYRVVSLASCTEVGLTTSLDTEMWWSQQSEEARRVLTDPSVQLISALTDFSRYLESFKGRRVLIWGNGSDFDNVILANAYQALGFDAPWPFYNNRCYRTIINCHKDRIEKLPREGVYHNALADAKYQATVMLQLQGIINGY